MKYIYVLTISLFLIGCDGNSSAEDKEVGSVKADPTKQIKTQQEKNTPPAVPEV